MSMKRKFYEVTNADGDILVKAAKREDENIENVKTLRNAVKDECYNTLKSVDASKLTVYADRAEYRREVILSPDSSVTALGNQGNMLTVVTPLRRNLAVYARVQYLFRQQLLDKVYNELIVDRGQFLLFDAPSNSGKSELLKLFRDQYPELNCTIIKCLDSKESAPVLLQKCGIDVYNETTSINPSQEHIVMIDEAQKHFSDTNFWNKLIKKTPEWLPVNVHFIISATYVLERAVLSGFVSLPKIGRCDFLLSKQEAQALFALPEVGLPDRIRKPEIIELVIHQCNGLISALCKSADAIKSEFKEDEDPSESALIGYYLSKTCLDIVAPFSAKHMTPSGANLQTF